MALALLVLGFVMNISGIAIGSSRDLSALCATVRTRVGSTWRKFTRSVRTLWAQLLRRQQDASVSAVTGAAAAVEGVGATVSTWDAVPDDLPPEVAIQRLRSRTDSLHEMLTFESARRTNGLNQLRQRATKIEEMLESHFTHLEARIDDLDVKSAGQRAMGAVLVICGSILMLLAALIGG